jgi:CHASE3 domain sensor protein
MGRLAGPVCSAVEVGETMAKEQRTEGWAFSALFDGSRWSLERKAAIGLGSALFLLALIGLVQCRSMRQVVENDARMSRAEVVMSELDAILAASLEAERGCAFYVFTGYLQSYLEAVPRAESICVALRP